MANPEKVRIAVALDGTGHGTVMLNGVDVSSAVESLRLSARAGEPTQLRLTVFADKIDVDALGEAVQLFWAQGQADAS